MQFGGQKSPNFTKTAPPTDFILASLEPAYTIVEETHQKVALYQQYFWNYEQKCNFGGKKAQIWQKWHLQQISFCHHWNRNRPLWGDSHQN